MPAFRGCRFDASHEDVETELGVRRRSVRLRQRHCSSADPRIRLTGPIGPSWLAEDASSVALIALHFVVAAVVIGGFASTLPVCKEHAGGRVTQSPHGAR
jgi:hypothetical protein